jgi:hypothetical protein
MAMLVHAVCATCGGKVQPKNKSGKVYVHSGLHAVGDLRSRDDVTRAEPVDHLITGIKMVTDEESY